MLYPNCYKGIIPAMSFPAIRFLFRHYSRGDPAWGPDFNTADLPILRSMSRVDGRDALHFAAQRD